MRLAGSATIDPLLAWRKSGVSVLAIAIQATPAPHTAAVTFVPITFSARL